MPSFLPPAAASSEVLRTLNEQNEAQKNLEVSADQQYKPFILASLCWRKQAGRQASHLAAHTAWRLNTRSLYDSPHSTMSCAGFDSRCRYCSGGNQRRQSSSRVAAADSPECAGYLSCILASSMYTALLTTRSQFAMKDISLTNIFPSAPHHSVMGSV